MLYLLYCLLFRYNHLLGLLLFRRGLHILTTRFYLFVLCMLFLSFLSCFVFLLSSLRGLLNYLSFTFLVCFLLFRSRRRNLFACRCFRLLVLDWLLKFYFNLFLFNDCFCDCFVDGEGLLWEEVVEGGAVIETEYFAGAEGVPINFEKIYTCSFFSCRLQVPQLSQTQLVPDTAGTSCWINFDIQFGELGIAGLVLCNE